MTMIAFPRPCESRDLLSQGIGASYGPPLSQGREVIDRHPGILRKQNIRDPERQGAEHVALGPRVRGDDDDCVSASLRTRGPSQPVDR